ncbi:phosphatase PAP2 family protein [Nocardioides bizhenqiangii]|uniref:Phosphatase PAP2 family protein n=1 Tax=Nocardioides bizhenqiangii TaxID=3095076 RepID=A0ABZ0ZRV8_9ACTN|nr:MULTISPECIES: phosphatase PAP2 family protein [unclassified Nocardioides]MDZ5622775.1 phosphatase PAP2 family protein [Nocardioides sp. HM23]WQQ27037.1 phosphatase PAP2 family protein [Nocardioides sp. HM61]
MLTTTAAPVSATRAADPRVPARPALSARTALLASLTSFGLVILIGLAMTGGTPGPGGLDASSAGFREWAVSHTWTQQPLLWVEWAFDKHTLQYWMLALAALLLLRRQVREALLTVAVMWTTLELTGWAKALFGRDRPQWQAPDHFHASGSFPSAHASGTAALMGLVLVFVVLRSRNAAVRLWGTVVVTATVLAVCLDRLFLGRHYPSDLAAGVLLGGGMVLVAMAFVSVQARERGTTLARVAPLQDRERVLVSRSA